MPRRLLLSCRGPSAAAGLLVFASCGSPVSVVPPPTANAIAAEDERDERQATGNSSQDGSSFDVASVFIFLETVSRLQPSEQKEHIREIYEVTYPATQAQVGWALPRRWPIPFDDRKRISPEELVASALREPFGSGALLAESRTLCLSLLESHKVELVRLLEKDLNTGDKSRALRTIGALRLTEFFGPVLALFENNAAWRRSAIYTLRDLGDPRAIGPIVQKFPSLKTHMVFEELRSLQRGVAAHPTLVTRLGSNDADERWRAAYSLAESGDTNLLPFIERLLQDDHPLVRTSAANMGFCIPREDFSLARPLLAPLLSDKDPATRVFVASCFAGRKDIICAPTLLELLKDESLPESPHSNVVQAIQSLTGTYFGYHVGSGAWQPTTEKNRLAIQRFAEWIERINSVRTR